MNFNFDEVLCTAIWERDRFLLGHSTLLPQIGKFVCDALWVREISFVYGFELCFRFICWVLFVLSAIIPVQLIEKSKVCG